MEYWIHLILTFVRQHQFWAIPMVFILAFGESLAFFSLLLPATIILLGLGFLIGEAGIPFFPIFIAATAGGFLGDWFSYWLGAHFRQQIYGIWPFNRYPEILTRAHAFFVRWGIISIFIGRFFGPLRAVIFLMAGVCGMGLFLFQVANLLSAILWAFGLLAPGAFGVRWLIHLIW